MEARHVVSNLAGAAAVAGVPFTAEQAEQLTQVLANASGTYRAGGRASAMNLDWNRADEQARGILSAPQMEFIQTVASPLAYDGRFMRRLADSMAEISKADAERKPPDAEKPSGG